MFSSFSYTQTGTVVVPSSAITVTPITTPFNPGFDFSAPASFSVAGNQTYQGTFGFFITVLPNGFPINDVTLTQLGGQALGTGSLSVTKTYCSTGGTIANCPIPPGGINPGLMNLAVNQNLTSVTSATFPAVTIMGVSDVLSLAGNDPNNAATNSAHVSDFRNQFSEIPEPSTGLTLFLLIGFPGLARAARLPFRR
jgi:hypothetical protein